MSFTRSLVLASVLGFSFSAVAAPHMNHVLNKIAGTYELNTPDALLGEKIQFTITNTGKLTDASSEQSELRTNGKMMRSFYVDGGLAGLPVYHLVVGDGSDEEQRDIHVLLSFDEDSKTRGLTIRLISVFEAINEGPNSASSTEIIPKATLRKKNAAGQFEDITPARTK